MDSGEEMFLQAIRDLFPQYSLFSDTLLQKKIGKEKFQMASLELLGFIRSGVDRELTKQQEYALISKTLSCLSKFISGKMGLPVTLTSLITHFSLLPFAVDEHFPSYHNSRLLLYIIGVKKEAVAV